VETLLEEGPIALVYTRKEHIKPEDYPASGFDGGVRRCLEMCGRYHRHRRVPGRRRWTTWPKRLRRCSKIGRPTACRRPRSGCVDEIDSTDAFEQPVGGALLTSKRNTGGIPHRHDRGLCPRETYVIANGEGPSLVAVCSGDCDCANCS
jgi:hypothetical protein